MNYSEFLRSAEKVRKFMSGLTIDLSEGKTWEELTKVNEFSSILEDICVLIVTKRNISVPEKVFEDYLSYLELLKAYRKLLVEKVVLLKLNTASIQ